MNLPTAFVNILHSAGLHFLTPFPEPVVTRGTAPSSNVEILNTILAVVLKIDELDVLIDTELFLISIMSLSLTELTNVIFEVKLTSVDEFANIVVVFHACCLKVLFKLLLIIIFA